MKNIKDAHLGFKLRVNKVDSLKNQRFAIPVIDEYIYQAFLIWLDNITKNNEDTDNADDLSTLIKKERIKLSLKNNEYEGTYPPDYFKKKSAYCIATKGKCSKNINLLDLPRMDKNESVKDPYFSPSFEWEESFIEFKDKIYVQTDGFKTTYLELEYIAQPERPANPDGMGGYTLPNGQPAVQKDINVSLVNAEKILDIAALIASMDITSQDIQNKQNKINLNKL